MDKLMAISPIDGRYRDALPELSQFFSEYAFIKYRFTIEVRWLQYLSNLSKVKEVPKFSANIQSFLDQLIQNFTLKDAQNIKTIERITQHDVKAIEYYLKKTLEQFNLHKTRHPIPVEFVHFACTSEDINNTAYAMMLRDFREEMLLPQLHQLVKHIQYLSEKFAKIPMLARTHGQPAVPTTLGKEFAVFSYRLQKQLEQLATLNIMAKFNGAVGNYNAHVFTYPDLPWNTVNQTFVEQLGLTFNPLTPQIEPHDFLAELAHMMMRLNTILIDFCRDVWGYISLGYFNQKMAVNTTGSSTMPHKINPIHFENAEGNLGLSNALFQYFANKLPISRFQRDLSDSTVLRNIGVAFAHSILSYQSIGKGLSSLTPNKKQIAKDLNDHWEILAEPIQLLMKKHGYTKAFEQLKTLTRGKHITQKTLHHVIDQLDLPKAVSARLKQLKPHNYLGLAERL